MGNFGKGLCDFHSLFPATHRRRRVSPPLSVVVDVDVPGAGVEGVRHGELEEASSSSLSSSSVVPGAGAEEASTATAAAAEAQVEEGPGPPQCIRGHLGEEEDPQEEEAIHPFCRSAN